MPHYQNSDSGVNTIILTLIMQQSILGLKLGQNYYGTHSRNPEIDSAKKVPTSSRNLYPKNGHNLSFIKAKTSQLSNLVKKPISS